jgi:hypothetical protein
MVFWKLEGPVPGFKFMKRLRKVVKETTGALYYQPSSDYLSLSLSVIEAPSTTLTTNGVRKGIRVRLPAHECQSDRFAPASHRGFCDGPLMGRLQNSLAAKRDASMTLN